MTSQQSDLEQIRRWAVLDLDETGGLTDPTNGGTVDASQVSNFLVRTLNVPEDTTDIIVYAHGWRNTRPRALATAHRLFHLVQQRIDSAAEQYVSIGAWRPFGIVIRWPSMSAPSPWGYARIRDRAHSMATGGQATQVLAHLLGYLNRQRRIPGRGTTLQTATGQYLHCIGHSFGCRLIIEAVQAAAEERPAVLGWDRRDPRYPYTVDTVLAFQMAASPAIFADRFNRMLGNAPINGPIVVTRSQADRATGLWHRLAEGHPGIGYIGAAGPDGMVRTTALRSVDERYDRAEFDARIVNVEATWRYRRYRWLRPEGAHSDFCHPESAHLFLTLAALAR